MKTAISIPDRLFNAAEQYAKAHGFSRSNLYAKAIAQFLERQSQDHITDQLNKVYGNTPSSLDSEIEELQLRSIKGQEW